jgi:hypothetical protein
MAISKLSKCYTSLLASSYGIVEYCDEAVRSLISLVSFVLFLVGGGKGATLDYAKSSLVGSVARPFDLFCNFLVWGRPCLKLAPSWMVLAQPAACL